jgi:biotin carboxylase
MILNNINNDEWLLILGASADQLYAIRTAQNMGLRVLTIDANPNSPGFKIADDFATISTKDIDAVKKLLDSFKDEGRKVSGVLVQGSDIPHIGCTLAGHINSPSIPMDAAEISTHKYKMKSRFKEKGIPIPWFSLVESAEHLKNIVLERGYPLIIKPVDRSGARGVFYLDENSNLDVLFKQSKELSFAGEVMAEEYLPGLQISTETIMYKGKAYTPGFADRNYEKLKNYAPNIIENGGWMPSSVTAEEREEVISLVEKAGLALGVTDGVVKGDVVITPDGAKMIEMATRLSGGDFCESLIPLSCDVNIVEAAINIFTGKEPDLDKLEPKFHLGVANRYFFPPAGKLISIEGIDAVTSQPWVKKFELWYKEGDMLPEIKSHADRFGVFVVTGKDRVEVEERITWVYETIKFNVDTKVVL